MKTPFLFVSQTETSKLFIYFIDIFYKNKYNSFISKLYYIGGIEMKFSNRLLLFLAGVVFVLLGLFLFTNPVANLVAYSWWISFGLLVSSIAAILGYFSAPKELRSPVYLFQGFVSLLLALYLVAYGFVTLPVVIPTIVGIWLIVEAIIAFFKGNRLRLIFPIIKNNTEECLPFQFFSCKNSGKNNRHTKSNNSNNHDQKNRVLKRLIKFIAL